MVAKRSLKRDRNYNDIKYKDTDNINGIYKVLSLVFSLLILLLSVLITIVLKYTHIESKQLGQMSILREFFVPCDDLSLSLEEDEKTFNGKTNKFKHFVDSDGTSICSFNNFTEIITKKIERASRIRLAKGLTFRSHQSCGNPALAPESGHLTAFLSQLSTEQPEQKAIEQNTVVNWATLSNYSFAGSGIKYNQGRIEVSEDKYYFVYTIITFNNTIGNSDCGSCMFRVSIYKTNVMYDGSYESRELQERETLCKRTNGISTLYIGSHIYLDKGDIIYVKVSDVSRLVIESTGNGLGLFPLH